MSASLNIKNAGPASIPYFPHVTTARMPTSLHLRLFTHVQSISTPPRVQLEMPPKVQTKPKTRADGLGGNMFVGQHHVALNPHFPSSFFSTTIGSSTYLRAEADQRETGKSTLP